MNYLNNATLIRRELVIRLAKVLFAGNIDEINKIPLEMAPKNGKSMRCCIHKDRAVIKYRLMALLGFKIEEETDELTRLSEYLSEALERNDIEGPVLTVNDEACSSCVSSNYFITNACQGCVARPCTVHCVKDAIDFNDRQAVINTEKCINCGKCMKECPYHAIIYIPIPCEEACPVNAISKDEFGIEKIDHEKCIYCGKCMKECPFSAIMEISHLVDILKHIINPDKKVTAMIAPAIVGQFAAEIGQVFTALKQLGFSDVIEVAYGADITTKKETEEFIERMESGENLMTSSCCPAYTFAVNKHINKLEKFVSDTKTPLHYTAEFVKEKDPENVTVFIGPCVAKRKESIENELVDYTLTIEELGSLFVARGIDVQKCEETEIDNPGKKAGRGFPVSGGVAAAVKQQAGEKVEINEFLINGIDKKSLRLLKTLDKKSPGNFVEVMACEGGCLSGPKVICNPKLSERSLHKLLTISEDS
ncbi:MAG: monomeric [FeFe] hydrogenase [Rhodothermaceae bacterium]